MTLPKASPHLLKAAPFLIEQDYAAYTTEQHGVWAELVRRRMPQLERHAAQEYLEDQLVQWSFRPMDASVEASSEKIHAWRRYSRSWQLQRWKDLQQTQW